MTDGGFVDRSSRRRIITGFLVVVDAVAVLAAGGLATIIRFGAQNPDVGFENISDDVTFLQVSVALAAIWLISFALSGLYNLERLAWGLGEFSRLARALAMGVVAFILFTYAIKTPGLSRAWTLVAFSLALVFVFAGRLVVRGALSRLRRRGRFQRRTLVVGCNEEAADLIRALGRRPEQGLKVVGFVMSAQAGQLGLDHCGPLAPLLGDARAVTDIVHRESIDTVIIASTAFDHAVMARMIAELRGVDVSIHVSSGLFEVLTTRVLVREVAGVPLITVRPVSLSAANLRTKRAFDLAVAGLVLIVGLPAWLFLMAAIKAESPGPVFYRQRRVGKDREPFDMLKFRSMHVDAEARLAELQEHNEATGPLFKMRNDPRVTRVGRFMRKFSIDEFPQLINVIKGEMSLVGPRPPLPNETTLYTDHHWRRMEVPPGLTGLWQVSGRSSLTFDEMIKLDLFYIENWSVGFDLALLLRTVPAVVFARGAY